MLIGLCGYKQSGKDTVADYLVSEYGYKKTAWADLLKDSVCALFDITRARLEEFKNADNVYVTLGYKNSPEKMHPDNPDYMWSPINELTFRQFLQHYGTRAHRNVFGDDFWVDWVLPYESFLAHPINRYSGKIVIPDCRFRNEISRIRNYNGKLILVDRKYNHCVDTHPSESPLELDYDFKINNNGTFHSLYQRVDQIMGIILANERT